MSIQRSESVWLILVLLAETVHFSKEHRWYHCIYTAAPVDRAMTTRITEHSGLKRPNMTKFWSDQVVLCRFGRRFLLHSRRWNLCAYRAHPTFELDSAAWRNPSKKGGNILTGAICTSCGATTCLNTLQSTTGFLSSFEYVWIGFDAFVLRNPELSCAPRAPRIATPPPYGYVLVTVYQARGVFGPALSFPRQSRLFSTFLDFSWHFGTFLQLFFPWQYKTCSCATGGDWSLFSKETSVWLSGSKHGLLWPKDAEVFLDRSCQTRYYWLRFVIAIFEVTGNPIGPRITGTSHQWLIDLEVTTIPHWQWLTEDPSVTIKLGGTSFITSNLRLQ